MGAGRRAHRGAQGWALLLRGYPPDDFRKAAAVAHARGNERRDWAPSSEKHTSLTLQESDVVSAALAHYRRKPALGFSDCLVLETARKAGHVPLGTFDKNLSKLENTKRL
jgi:predicted nucleic acid-binding protein